MQTSTIAIIATLIVMALTGHAQENRFTCSSGTGVTYVVTESGLTEVRIGEDLVASGSWSAGDAGRYFPSVNTPAGVGKRTESALEKIGSSRVEVRHEYDGATARFRYSFDGEDVHVEARVENHHRSAPLEAISFGGLTLQFASKARDNSPMHSTNYIEQMPLRNYCYPSHFQRHMGVYAAGEKFGVGMVSTAPRIERNLWWRRGASDKENPHQQGLTYIVAEPIPYRGARTFTYALRFSPKTDWKHLLAPYKEQFWKIHGEMHYEPDYRPWARFGGPTQPKQSSPDNPLGYNGFFRRLDLEEGVETFCDRMVPNLKKAGAAGVIFWQPQGYDPRGQLYRADFQVWPPQVREHLPELVRRFKEADLRLGLLARVGQFPVRVSWRKDWTFHASARNPRTMHFVWQRFKWARDQGFDAFYIDSFGHSYGDVVLLRKLRERLGPEPQTFVEHDVDAVLPYSGLYSPPKSVIYRWLVPHIASIHPTGPSPEQIQKRIRQGILPLIADYQLDDAAAVLRKHSSEGDFVPAYADPD